MPLQDGMHVQTRLRRLQARAFSLTWFSYASYYLTRKNFSVVKSRLNSDLGLSIEMLAFIDTLYLVLYAVGQFVNGALGDRFGPRRMIALGMWASALVSLWFGLSSVPLAFAMAFGLNGFFQATGWPNNVKAMEPWFDRRTRGAVMGLWCTNFQLGGLVATALATYLLINYGWRMAFMAPAVWVAVVGLALFLFLIERPEDRGISPVKPETENPKTNELMPAAAGRAPFLEMIRIPALWALGGSYFGLKLIRYSLLFWLPFYLNRALHYTEGAAGYLSTAFEAGGIIGAIIVGWVSDRYFSKNRLRLVVPLLFALAGSFLVYLMISPLGKLPNVLGLGLIGFLLFGPDALISGAVAQDIGRGRATASAAGLINGLGSTGAALQGIFTAYVAKMWGWHFLFYAFVAFASLSALAILPLAIRKKA